MLELFFSQQLIDKVREINTLIEVDFSGFQDWDTLKEHKIGKVIILNGSGVLSTKKYELEDYMQFSVTIPPGSGMKRQWHNFIELTRVVSGEMKDKISGNVYKNGSIAAFPPYQHHQPVNNSMENDLTLQVEIYKT